MLKEIGIFQFFILWERIILVFVLAVLYRHIAGRKKFSYLPFLQFLVIFLPIRDVVLTFFPIVEIFMISDIVVFSILFFFLKEQAGNRPYDPAAIVLAIAYGIILLVQSRFPVYPEGIARFQRIPLVLYGLFIGGASFLRGKKDPLAFSCRYPLLLGLLAYNAFLIFLGDEDPISQAIAVPAPYLIPLFILFRQNAMLEKEKDLQIESLSAQIDSLFEFMRNIGSAITEKIELSRVLTYITATAVRNTEAEAGAVLLIKEGHNLTVQAVSGFFPPPYPVTAEESASERSLMETFKSRELPIGSTILGETVQSGTPVIIKDSRWDVRLKNNSGPGLTHISSLIAIPLIVSKKILGVLAVVKTRENSEFTDGNLFSLRSFADYTSLTLDNLLTYIELLEKKEMEREVFIAADIQQKLLPSKIKPVKGVSISAFSIPAKGVSGDYYDVIPFKGKPPW